MSADRDRAGQVRLGVDIGGTFTDAVAVDQRGGVTAYKVPTTPAKLSAGFMAAVDIAIDDRCEAPWEVHSIAHATTAATNAIIEGTGARVALVVTEGFRDILEIARQIRPDLFDLLRRKPPPLVSRDRVFEVAERVGPTGEVLRPLDTGGLDALTKRIIRSEVEAVVVCLLHSYINSEHEMRVAEHLREKMPAVDVSISAEIWPEFREYFRACTTVINAMVRPIIRSYLSEVREEMTAREIHRPLWVMQSSGGVLSEQAATEVPVKLIESGPAAGLTYAAHLGRLLGHPNLVSFEVGGTTAKTGLIVDGLPAMTSEFEVGTTTGSSVGRGRASGYPVKTPVFDLVEIGAGGGSLAWIDSGGALRVGPRSAGADPGPACYGSGGDRPTLTDANLALGRIDPDRFLGGQMPLSVEAAVKAIERHCATPLGLTVAEAARGIVEIATASMARALRLVTVERGHDPRDFVLLAFGGAGPLHAAALAGEMGFSEVVVPQLPGVLSAAGLLVAPVQVVETRTALVPLAEVDERSMVQRFGPLIDKAIGAVADQGVDPHEVEISRAVDLRYRGQAYELTIMVGDLRGVDFAAGVAGRFHRAHERTYGHSAPDEPIEVVNWRVTATQKTQLEFGLPELADTKGSGPKPVARRRSSSARTEIPVFERTDLRAGDGLTGPAVIAEPYSTTYVPEGHRVRVDSSGNLSIRLGR